MVHYLGTNSSTTTEGVEVMTLNYEIGKNREIESEVLSKGCTGNITDIDLNATAVRSHRNDTFDLLRLRYEFPKADLTTDKVEFCQIVRMIFPPVIHEGVAYPKMILTEDVQNLTIRI